MALFTKVTGLIVKQMDAEDSFMQMETCITDSGKTTKLTAKEFTHIWMARPMTEIGKKISSMA